MNILNGVEMSTYRDTVYTDAPLLQVERKYVICNSEEKASE